MSQQQGLSRLQLSMIIGGILSFVLFFAIGTSYYPGGSNFDAHTSGYRWNYNYWCELLGEYAKNGELNTARPLGFFGMISLSFGVSCFWLFITPLILTATSLRYITSILGVSSMILASLIFTELHDIVIYCAVVCGSISFVLLFYGLFIEHKMGLFTSGIFCLSLILLNCIIYVTKIGISYLPSLQKLTFLLMLLWICSLTFLMRSKNNQ